jgi:hypothetical protein
VGGTLDTSVTEDSESLGSVALHVHPSKLDDILTDWGGENSWNGYFGA